MDTLKQQAYQFCEHYIQNRIHRINENITEIENSLSSETKSSAGDKHETGRAMLQLEREKLGQQLFEAEKTVALLQRINPLKHSKVIGIGSLVETETMNYYIAISAGKFEKDQKAIYCISASTPIGKLLMGKTKGASLNFKGRAQKIVAVR